MPLSIIEWSGFVGIKLLPLAINLPLEYLSLRISFFLDVRNETIYLHFPDNDAKMFSQFNVLNFYHKLSTEVSNQMKCGALYMLS